MLIHTRCMSDWSMIEIPRASAIKRFAASIWAEDSSLSRPDVPLDQLAKDRQLASHVRSTGVAPIAKTLAMTLSVSDMC
ncbi:hypothetical protein D3C77_403660 [compost metagenome]